MFLISIAMGRSQPVIWTLMFKTQERAEQSFKLLQDNMGEIALGDDFGQTINIDKANIGGMLFEDLDQSKNAHIERALHQARVQAEGQTMAESDHVLRAARARQGSAILTPGIPSNGMMR